MGKKNLRTRPGAPLWMATFADLMALLMCFFVMLLAFSELDVMKFKQIAGSMKYAFGVQYQIEAQEIPKGTSAIALEFRPGRPDDTPVEVIQQETQDPLKASLKVPEGTVYKTGAVDDYQGQPKRERTILNSTSDAKSIDSSQDEQLSQALAADTKRIREALLPQIADGAIEVESLGQQITIRIHEKGAFASGSAFLQPQFRPVINKIGQLIKDIPGEIVVAGHTDKQMINNEMYRSNWALSAMRAVSVVHVLSNTKGLVPSRVVVEGRAGYTPLVEASSKEGYRNRRVEITIRQGRPLETKSLSSMP